jgi:hypothetical protein
MFLIIACALIVRHSRVGTKWDGSVRQAAHFERDQPVRPQPDRSFLVTNDGVI